MTNEYLIVAKKDTQVQGYLVARQIKIPEVKAPAFFYIDLVCSADRVGRKLMAQAAAVAAQVQVSTLALRAGG